jgi:hypothetical protein
LTGEKLPGVHLVHWVDPFWAVNIPGAQASHDEKTDSAENMPVMHAVHELDPVTLA